MTTVTDEPFRADVDEVLARYGLDDPGHAVLASDLSDAFDEALRDAAAEVERLRSNLQMIESCAARDIDALFAENERLRAAAGERDALRTEVERLRAAYGKAAGAMAAFDKWRRDGCEYHPLQLDELQSQFAAATAALAAVPTPQQTPACTCGMGDATMTTITDEKITEWQNERERCPQCGCGLSAHPLIEELRAERDALQGVLLEMVLQFEGIARPGRLSISVADSEEAKKTIALAKAAVARRAVDAEGGG